jgi:hypothetical protein
VTAVVVVAVKLLAYALTGSVGLLSDAVASVIALGLVVVGWGHPVRAGNLLYSHRSRGRALGVVACQDGGDGDS